MQPEHEGKSPALRADDRPDEGDPEDFVDELKPGTKLLNGQYTILSYLNSGGFGITYLATDSLDRTVVIKECFPNSLCRRSATTVRARSRAHRNEYRSVVSLFVQEARSLAKLVHPNIVGVHQVFEDNATAYMAIDYVNGKDMLDMLESPDHQFTPAEVVDLLKKTLGAVEFIHQAGMLHRDISPDNILIDPHRNPILIDFGAAREQGSKAGRSVTARRVVKDGYSPQEFYLTGAEQGPYSDLYALGATFFHVISGAAPPESQRRLAAIAEGDPDPYQPLAGRFAGYPSGFLQSIDKAVRVMPKDRIDTAANWLKLICEAEAGTWRQASGRSRSISALRKHTRILTNIISQVAVAEAAIASRIPLLISSAIAGALTIGLGLGIWMTVDTDPEPVSTISAEPAAGTGTNASVRAKQGAPAEAVAKARADLRLAAEAAAQSAGAQGTDP